MEIFKGYAGIFFTIWRFLCSKNFYFFFNFLDLFKNFFFSILEIFKGYARISNFTTQTSADNCHQALGSYVEKLNSSAELHDPLKRFCESSIIKDVSEDTYRCATLLLHDFEKSGINLPEKERTEYVQIHSDIISNVSTLSQCSREPSAFPKLRNNKYLFL